MDDYILTEFSIFYKRLMKLERCLKTLILTQYTNAYASNAYKTMYRYFQVAEKNRHVNDCTFSKIYSSSKSDDEKFILSVNSMYISEILYLFYHPVFLKNKARHIFFAEEVETNSTFFQRKGKFLRAFRNCVAHCDEKKLAFDRTKFIDSLVYFEKILNCNDAIDFDLLSKIGRAKKLSINAILNIISKSRPNYFKNDKLLLLLFDDIALMTGYTFKDLPQRWSIIRQKFEMNKKLKLDVHVPQLKEDLDANKDQLSMNFDSQ